MGSGCLSPTPAKGEIDIQTLDHIYEEVDQMSLPQSNCPYQSIEYYPIIKEKLGKKGQMRKLIDYLSSHRYRICDNLYHSFRIVNQTKKSRNKYVVVIMLEQLFKIINTQPAQQQEITLKSIHSQGNIEEKGERRLPTNISELSLGRFPDPSLPTNESNPKCIIVCQLTSYKFESTYFNVISNLLQQEDEIYSLALKNIICYCSFLSTPFSSEKVLEQIMKVLLDHIHINDQLVLTIHAYLSLLTRIKPWFFQTHLHNLRDFILIWRENYAQQLSQSNEKINIIAYCEEIICIFMKKGVEGQHLSLVCQVIFQIFDASCFDCEAIESLVKYASENIDLKEQFLRTLTLHLLAYASVPQSQTLIGKWQNAFPAQTYENLHKKYQNIVDSRNKINSLKSINRWIHKYNFVDVKNLIQYSCGGLIATWVFNLFSSFFDLKNGVIQQCLHFFQPMKKKQRIQLLDFLMRQMVCSYLDDQVRYPILTICRTILEREELIQVSESETYLFPCLNSEYLFETNNKILEYTDTLISKIKKNRLIDKIEEICKFLYSFYFEIKEGPSVIKEKNILIDSWKKIIQRLMQMNSGGIVKAFIEKIMMEKRNKAKADLFYHDWIIYSGREATNKQFCFPRQFSQFLKKLLSVPQFQSLELFQRYQSTGSNDQSIKLNIPHDNAHFQTAQNSFKLLFSSDEGLMGTNSGFFMQKQSVISTNSLAGREDFQLQGVIDVLNH